ncbi:MAG TPA: hypothetical protein ENN81_00620, partial [Phycisphaerales bacterium]|nr:hypothetical protein [Phycisphaerales bacterium]
MVEDRLLLWRFKRGDGEALRRIYEKYRTDLLRLAISVLNRTRNIARATRPTHRVSLEAVEPPIASAQTPDQWVACSEQLHRV